MVSEFTQTYKNTISGKYDQKRYGDSGTNMKKREISGGARIKLMFHSLYKDLGPNYSATAEYSDFDIEKSIIMHEGDTLGGFPSVDVFIYLIQPQL